MADKKVKDAETEEVKTEEVETAQKNASETKKADKPVKAKAKKADKKKTPNRFAKWWRDLGAELKKVTWPSFGKVMQQTGVVIVVTLCFLLVVGLMDAGLTALYQLLIKLPVEIV